MLFSSAKISAEILEHILGYRFCANHHFGTFLLNVVAIKRIRNYFCKSSSDLVPKLVVKLTPGQIFANMSQMVDYCTSQC